MFWLPRAIVTAAVFTGFAATIQTVQIIALPLYFISPTGVYQDIIDHSQIAFCELIILLHTILAPGELVVTGDEVDTWWYDLLQPGTNSVQNLKLRSVVISNHLTLLDWIYIWMCTYYWGNAHAIKIILKSSPKYLPLYGPVSYLYLRFTFLR
jgi:1-acyl-sn-glycerol-3-phosphate acyltransferase